MRASLATMTAEADAWTSGLSETDRILRYHLHYKINAPRNTL